DEAAATAMRETLLARAPEASSLRTRTFLELARASSVDEETQRQSGRLNPLPAPDAQQSERDQTLAAALFALEPYQVSEVLELDNGWGFVMLESVIEPLNRDLASVEPEIRVILSSRDALAAFEAHVQAERANVEVFADVLDQLSMEDGTTTEDGV